MPHFDEGYFEREIGLPRARICIAHRPPCGAGDEVLVVRMYDYRTHVLIVGYTSDDGTKMFSGAAEAVGDRLVEGIRKVAQCLTARHASFECSAALG